MHNVTDKVLSFASKENQGINPVPLSSGLLGPLSTADLWNYGLEILLNRGQYSSIVASYFFNGTL